MYAEAGSGAKALPIFDDFFEEVKNTMTIVGQAYTQVVASLTEGRQ
jgi:hypothetical protein